jgi:hypothetical protein
MITEAMASLRNIIDQHEKATLEQILMTEKGQKKQLKDYKTPLKNELQNLSMQKATYEILLSSKKYIQLLQAKQEFDKYVMKTHGILKSSPLPTRTEYCLGGLDQLRILKENIIQCGRYIELPSYRNLQLERFIADRQTAEKLDLSRGNLTDSDMKIVADLLRKNIVRKHFFLLAIFL